jgi:hypothetical protein
MAELGVFQALRATVFAVVCVLLGAAGHALASGTLPPLVGLITGLPLVALLTGWLARRQRTLPVLAAAVTSTQLSLHALFDYAAANPAAGDPHAGHLAVAAGHAGHAAGSLTAAMACAHLVAGMAAAWWLRRGESAVFAHCAAMAAAVLPLVHLFTSDDPIVLPAAPLAPPRQTDPLVRLHEAPLRHSVVRRGPPAALLAS